eukprot:13250709-Heterocapsa_arctica.AAC.1
MLNIRIQRPIRPLAGSSDQFRGSSDPLGGFAGFIQAPCWANRQMDWSVKPTNEMVNSALDSTVKPTNRERRIRSTGYCYH